VRPDVKRDKAAERPQPPTPPAVAPPQAKVSAPAPVTAPASQTPPPRTERPSSRPAAGQLETQGRRPEQPAEPVVASPEPSQPRGARP
jgi:hypothetical protein